MNQHQPNSQRHDSSQPDQALAQLKQASGASAYRVLFGVDIESDRTRYRDISRGRIRKDLGKYMSQDEIIAQKGKDTIKIPLPRIDNPHFETRSSDGDGVGQGDGEPGDSVGRGNPKNGKPGGQNGDGKGEGAGEGAGNHIFEEVTLDELADMLGEELKLPRIEPKGNKSLPTEDGTYDTISRKGPRGLLHLRRTFKEALKRSIASGEYDPTDPKVVFHEEDLRYRDFRPNPKPEFNACIVYVMDVSGSMDLGQKDIARKVSFWIDLWLKRQYDNIDQVFIIHDEDAEEVTEEEFFTTNATGGTKISSAYQQVLKVLDRYPESEWNMYMFQFSDGDNFPHSDNAACVDLLKSEILPRFNQVAYGQIPMQQGRRVPSAETNGFYQILDRNLSSEKNLVKTPIADDTKILDAIRKFFSEGK